MASTRRNELIHRLVAGCCEICKRTENLEVHHMRKLADLTKPGREDKPGLDAPSWRCGVARRW